MIRNKGHRAGFSSEHNQPSTDASTTGPDSQSADANTADPNGQASASNKNEHPKGGVRPESYFGNHDIDPIQHFNDSLNSCVYLEREAERYAKEGNPQKEQELKGYAAASRKNFQDARAWSQGGNGSAPIFDSVDSDLPDQVDFPVQLLPQHEMVEAVAESIDVHPNLPALISMGIVSGSIGRGLEMRSGPNQTLKANIYILVSAISGEGKTATANQLDFPLKEHAAGKLAYWEQLDKPRLIARQARLNREHKSVLEKLYGAKSASLTAAEKKNLEDRQIAIWIELEKLKKDCQEPTFWTEDATQEVLVKLMFYNHEQLLSYSTDARKAVQNLFGLYNKLQSPEDNFYVKAFSGDPFRSDRVGRDPYCLESPCLSLLWMLQPELFKQLLANRWLQLGGFLPRILPGDSRLEPHEDKGTRKTVAAAIRDGWATTIEELITRYREAGTPKQIPDTNSNAESIFRDYKNSLVPLRRGKDQDISSYVVRWAEHAQRIAIGLHAINSGQLAHTNPLTDETVNSAVEIMKWFAGEQQRMLAASRYESLKDLRGKLKTLLQNEYKNGVALRRLRKNHGWQDRDVEHLAAVFEKDFSIFDQKNPKGGPSSRCIKLKK